MVDFTRNFLYYVSYFYIAYLLLFAAYSFLSISVGAYKLYIGDRMVRLRNKLQHEDLPISIIVPAYNEAVTIVESVRSILTLDYQLYEIVVVDDGSTDTTSQELIEAFDLKYTSRPIRHVISCQPEEAVHENVVNGIHIMLIRKINGGKGDALNMGINACKFPFFICIDADSKFQKNSLREISEPVFEDDTVVAVGGLIVISQCVIEEDGIAVGFRLPRSLLVSLQAVEYNRSFLASRILMDAFNGNLIISGAFGLFKKATVAAAGGYNTGTLGEDMELVMKIHVFCRNNNIPYRMAYQPSAICMTQAPTTLRDLSKQRRRWHVGLLQSMYTHRKIFFNFRFGLVSFFSYLYYLLYELISPLLEVFGILIIVAASLIDVLNWEYMVVFFIVYAIYGSIISLSALSQQLYTQKFRISGFGMLKALILCILEFGFFRYVLVIVRLFTFLRYRKYKGSWGKIKRV